MPFRLKSTAIPLFACSLLFAFLVACGGSDRGDGGGGAGTTPVSISTSSIPNGQVGTAYSTTLIASGGHTPYSWTITSGILPDGLSLNAATGAITGTPGATADATPLTVRVTDSGVTPQTATASLTLTITAAAAPIAVAISPKRLGLTVTQSINITATLTNDSSNQGVKWTSSGGSFSSSTSASGTPVKYTASASANIYTVTATSVADSSKSVTISVGVTDLPGVITYHNDGSRDGNNSSEQTLSPATVTVGTFGKLFSCTVDGAIYAQPLWLPNITVAGSVRNVVFVATQHDSLYAFDADMNTSPCTPLWKVSLIDAAHGGTGGETPISFASGLVGQGFGDIMPEIGVTGTPVIDAATSTLYVVSKSIAGAGPFFHRIHAIDIATGLERANSPAVVSASVPGNGYDASSGTVTFNPQTANQRSGLTLTNGVVYVTWASHETKDPYHGWIIAFDKITLAVKSVFNTTPNAQRGGIWMAGGAPAFDSSNLYFITANGTYDANNNNYGDSFLKLAQSTLEFQDYFTPADELARSNDDLDLGSGGASILVDLPSAPNPHLLIGGGKRDAGSGVPGQFFVLNRDNMGHFTNDNSGAVQLVPFDYGIFSTPAFWNNTLYAAGVGGPMRAYTLNTTTGLFNTTPSSQSSFVFNFPGSTPSITARTASSGIVWAIDSSQYCTLRSGGSTAPCGPAVLHALDASNLANELWNSSQGTGNTAGLAVKFTVPTAANGKVYIGTRGNDTGTGGTSIPGELDVYGLLPN